MFNDCGKELKFFASLLFLIQIIGILVASFYLFARVGLLVTLLIVPCLFIANLIISLFLYNVGEISENLKKIEKNTRKPDADAPEEPL